MTYKLQILKNVPFLANIPVSVSIHRSLNSSKGVISESDLLYVPEAEIFENMKEKGVTDVHRIIITKNNNQTHNSHDQFPKTFSICKSLIPQMFRKTVHSEPFTLF